VILITPWRKQTSNHACNDFDHRQQALLRSFIACSLLEAGNDCQTELMYKGWRTSTGNHQSLELMRAKKAGTPHMRR